MHYPNLVCKCIKTPAHYNNIPTARIWYHFREFKCPPPPADFTWLNVFAPFDHIIQPFDIPANEWNCSLLLIYVIRDHSAIFFLSIPILLHKHSHVFGHKLIHPLIVTVGKDHCRKRVKQIKSTLLVFRHIITKFSQATLHVEQD